MWWLIVWIAGGLLLNEVLLRLRRTQRRATFGSYLVIMIAWPVLLPLAIAMTFWQRKRSLRK